MLKATFRWIMALFFVAAGANHLLAPKFYLELMPAWLPWHQGLIFASGFAEILLGVSVLLPRLRGIAGWGLIALLIAIFPANIHAALHGFRSVPGWILWARLPFQLVLIAWVYWCCLGKKLGPESS
ncbi:MAG: hypothetical protein QOE70_4158 [Chthoniobacter sp.]|jgi:uncharacterized membrane protein|nr:hypothetical protein [Chthoniobacter sp.]